MPTRAARHFDITGHLVGARLRHINLLMRVYPQTRETPTAGFEASDEGFIGAPNDSHPT